MIEESAASDDDARHATLADDAALDFGVSAATDAKSSRYVLATPVGSTQSDNTASAEPLSALLKEQGVGEVR